MLHLQTMIFDHRIGHRWSRCLPLIQRLCNSNEHSCTGFSPNQIVFGGRISLDRGFGPDIPSSNPFVPLVTPAATASYVEQLRSDHHLLTTISAEFQQEHKVPTPPHPSSSFSVGDYVLCVYPPELKPPSKLHPRLQGPLLILAIEGTSVTLRNLTTKRSINRQINSLRVLPIPDDITDVPRYVASLATADSTAYAVESILSHHGDPSRPESLDFKVRWAGFDESWDTFIPYAEASSLAALDTYIAVTPELAHLVNPVLAPVVTSPVPAPVPPVSSSRRRRSSRRSAR